MSLEDQVAEMLADYASGLYTRGELRSRVIAWLTPTNIDAVLAALPDAWRPEIERHLRSLSGYEPLIGISGAIYKWETEPDPMRREEMLAEHLEAQARAKEHSKMSCVPPFASGYANALDPSPSHPQPGLCQGGSTRLSSAQRSRSQGGTLCESVGEPAIDGNAQVGPKPARDPRMRRALASFALLALVMGCDSPRERPAETTYDPTITANKTTNTITNTITNTAAQAQVVTGPSGSTGSNFAGSPRSFETRLRLQASPHCG